MGNEESTTNGQLVTQPNSEVNQEKELFPRLSQLHRDVSEALDKDLDKEFQDMLDKVNPKEKIRNYVDEKIESVDFRGLMNGYLKSKENAPLMLYDSKKASQDSKEVPLSFQNNNVTNGEINHKEEIPTDGEVISKESAQPVEALVVNRDRDGNREKDSEMVVSSQVGNEESQESVKDRRVEYTPVEMVHEQEQPKTLLDTYMDRVSSVLENSKKYMSSNEGKTKSEESKVEEVPKSFIDDYMGKVSSVIETSKKIISSNDDPLEISEDSEKDNEEKITESVNEAPKSLLNNYMGKMSSAIESSKKMISRNKEIEDTNQHNEKEPLSDRSNTSDDPNNLDSRTSFMHYIDKVSSLIEESKRRMSLNDNTKLTNNSIQTPLVPTINAPLPINLDASISDPVSTGSGDPVSTGSGEAVPTASVPTVSVPTVSVPTSTVSLNEPLLPQTPTIILSPATTKKFGTDHTLTTDSTTGSSKPFLNTPPTVRSKLLLEKVAQFIDSKQINDNSNQEKSDRTLDLQNPPLNHSDDGGTKSSGTPRSRLLYDKFASLIEESKQRMAEGEASIRQTEMLFDKPNSTKLLPEEEKKPGLLKKHTSDTVLPSPTKILSKSPSSTPELFPSEVDKFSENPNPQKKATEISSNVGLPEKKTTKVDNSWPTAVTRRRAVSQKVQGSKRKSPRRHKDRTSREALIEPEGPRVKPMKIFPNQIPAPSYLYEDIKVNEAPLQSTQNNRSDWESLWSKLVGNQLSLRKKSESEQKPEETAVTPNILVTENETPQTLGTTVSQSPDIDTNTTASEPASPRSDDTESETQQSIKVTPELFSEDIPVKQTDNENVDVPSLPKEKIYIKVILLGDPEVGKTKLFHSFIYGKYTPKYESTLKIASVKKSINITDKEIIMRVWDTPGRMRFSQYEIAICRGADIIALVFDVGNPKSFDHLSQWHKLFTQHTGILDVPSVVIGNKTDTKLRKVTQSKASKWSSSNDMLYLETSAKDKTSVLDAFVIISMGALSKRVSFET